MSDPSKGLYVPPGLWRELISFSGDAVCLVFASKEYDENDYIRNYKKFLEFKNGNSTNNKL